MINHNPTWTRLLGKFERLRLPGTLVLHADVRQLPEVSCALAVLVLHGSDEHAEPGLEGCHFASLSGVEEGVGHVVDHLINAQSAMSSSKDFREGRGVRGVGVRRWQ